jgi:hypothetical protein
MGIMRICRIEYPALTFFWKSSATVMVMQCWILEA